MNVVKVVLSLQWVASLFNTITLRIPHLCEGVDKTANSSRYKTEEHAHLFEKKF